MDGEEMKIGYGVSHTLEETARHFGITRQRVQQIEQSALRKLRLEMKRRYGATDVLDLL